MTGHRQPATFLRQNLSQELFASTQVSLILVKVGECQASRSKTKHTIKQNQAWIPSAILVSRMRLYTLLLLDAVAPQRMSEEQALNPKP